MDNVIGGYEREILYDKKNDNLDIELAYDKIDCPVLIFNVGKGDKAKEVFRLHIKEAIELKAIIDCLVADFHEEELDQLKNKLSLMEVKNGN